MGGSDFGDGHAPRPGPAYWDFKCLVCDCAVDRHPNLIQRMLIRFRQRKANNG